MPFKFLKPQVIYETASSHNGKIQVVKILGTLKLVVDGATQSANYKSDYAKTGYWRRAASLITSKAPSAKNMLFLGLGSGTVLNYVAEKYPEVHQYAVELDGEIIAIAQKYFDLNTIKSLKIINASAFDVLDDLEKYELPSKFDVVFVDMFIGGTFVNIPDRKKFFMQLKKYTNFGGLVLFNHTFDMKSALKPEFFIKDLELVFGNIQYEVFKRINGGENYLVYSFVR